MQPAVKRANSYTIQKTAAIVRCCVTEAMQNLMPAARRPQDQQRRSAGGRGLVDIAAELFVLQPGQIDNDQRIDAVAELRIDIEVDEAHAVRVTDFAILLVRASAPSSPYA